MCGFVFFLESKYRQNKKRSSSYGNLFGGLESRGPDDKKTIQLQNEYSTLTFYHFRLHIKGLKKDGVQPKVDNDERWFILFNGEIYNTIELSKKVGFSNPSGSDTELLLFLIERFGIETTIYQIKGMFSVFIFDKFRSKIYLFRDTYGQKPLYFGYTDKKNEIVVSSDANIARNFLGISRKDISKEAAEMYLAYGYYPILSSSITERLDIVQGGELVDIQLSSKLNKILSIERLVDYVPSRKMPSQHFKTDTKSSYLNSILLKSFKEVYETNTSSAFLLSGGVDSGLLVNFLSNKYDLNTLSACFSWKKSINECKKLLTLNSYSDLNHHNIEIKENEFLSEMNSFFSSVDEPISDTAAIPLKILSKFSRGKFKVLYSGDGADELFGGYDRYRKFLLKNLLLFLYSKEYITKKYLKYLSILNLDEKSIDSIISKNNYSFDEDDRLAIPLRVDSKQYLQKNILIKSDRASMMHGIEVRSPYLYEDIVYGASLFFPTSDLYSILSGKKPLIKIAESSLGRRYVRSKKMGFGTPFDDWILPNLKSKYKQEIELFCNSNKSLNFSKVFLIESKKIAKHYEDLFLWRAFTLMKWIKGE